MIKSLIITFFDYLGLISILLFCICSFCFVGRLFDLGLYGYVLVAGGQGGEVNIAEGEVSSVSV